MSKQSLEEKYNDLAERLQRVEELLFDTVGKVNTLSIIDTTLEKDCETLLSKNMPEIKSSGKVDSVSSGPKPDNIKKFFINRMMDENFKTKVSLKKKDGTPTQVLCTYKKLFGNNKTILKILEDEEKYKLILSKISDETKREERRCGLIWEILNEYEGFENHVKRVNSDHIDYKNQFKESKREEENNEL